MNIFPFLSLISATILFSLGIFIFSRNPKSPLHRVFLLLALTISWWAFTEFMLRYVTGYPEAWFWMKMSAFWTFVPALSLNFIWIFTQQPGQKRSTWMYLFMYVPALVFCILELATDLVNVRPVMKYWGYAFAIADDPWIYYIEIAWAFSLLGLSLLGCLDYYLSTQDTRKKMQAEYILIGIGVPSVSAVLGVVVLPLFGVVVPEMIVIFALFFSVFVGYATWKYDLFVLTPAAAADTIVSTMTDMLVLVDADERIVAVNRATCDTLGFSEREVIGSPVGTLVCGLPGNYGIIDGFIGKGDTVPDAETECRQKDGKVIPVSLSASVIRDGSGTISGIVIVLRDITRRKVAETELMQVLEKLHLLSGITRHDILNQLAALKAYLELAEAKEKDPDILLYLRKMQKTADVIDGQIRFMQDYENMGMSAPVWHDVDEGIRQSITSLPVRDVRADIALEGVEVYADPLFEKVFYNLIDNALRYGGEKLTTIRISASESPAGLLIVCEDNGAGILPEDKLQLFRKGFGKHTGLGLFLVRKILAITGITIRETSNAGSGARFEIAVPPGVYRLNPRDT